MARKNCRTDSTNVHESPNGSSSDMISHNQQGVLWEYECRPEWRAFDSQTAKHESSQFRAPSRATNLASDWLRRKCKAQAIGPQASGVLAIIIHPSFLLPVTTVTAARAKQYDRYSLFDTQLKTHLPSILTAKIPAITPVYVSHRLID